MLSVEDKAKIQQTLTEISGLLEQGRPLNKDYSNDDLRIIYSFAYTLYQTGDYDQAKPIFQQLAAFKPFEQKYWLGLAACWQMEKQYDEALKGWAMAFLLKEEDPIPHFHAAECYEALGNDVEGIKAIRACRARLTKSHLELEEKLIHLEYSLKREQQGA